EESREHDLPGGRRLDGAAGMALEGQLALPPERAPHTGHEAVPRVVEKRTRGRLRACLRGQRDRGHDVGGPAMLDEVDSRLQPAERRAPVGLDRLPGLGGECCAEAGIRVRVGLPAAGLGEGRGRGAQGYRPSPWGLKLSRERFTWGESPLPLCTYASAEYTRSLAT